MARSTYYYHISRIKRTDKYNEIRGRIADIFQVHHKRYAYRRIHMQLINEGYLINHKTVQKLMVQMHLKSKVGKVKYRSYKGTVGRIAPPNILDRDFKAEKPYRKWATDVTEFKIEDKKAYLSPIIDMFNGEIISYSISDQPNLRMVMEMIKNAPHHQSTGFSINPRYSARRNSNKLRITGLFYL